MIPVGQRQEAPQSLRGQTHFAVACGPSRASGRCLHLLCAASRPRGWDRAECCRCLPNRWSTTTLERYGGGSTSRGGASTSRTAGGTWNPAEYSGKAVLV